MKKAISALTALILTFTVFMGVIPVGAEEVMPDEQASLNNDISVMGTNSFGALLSDRLSEKMDEQQQNNGCNIFSAEVTENKADVSFETAESCTLLVAVYDESGEQMLASGHEEVTKDETEKTVTIETDSMPKYFYLRAFLVDTNTLRPICTAYKSPNYTKEMQEFFAKTVDDFDGEKVLNFDNDKSNNFAVYGEGTKVIESDGAVNKVTKSDEENGIYVIENADSAVTALAKDDVFALAQPDGNVLIAKVGTIKVSGKTVTITEQETSMEEVFDYIRIDESKGMENATVDNSNLKEGVTYNGIVENTPESRTYSQENTYNSDEAYLPAAPEYQAVDIDVGRSESLSYSFFDVPIGGAEDTLKLPGDIEGKAAAAANVSGGVKFTATGTVKVYLSDSYSYLEAKLDLSAEISVSLTGKVSGSVPLGLIGISPVPGVYIEFTPSLAVEASAKIELSGKLEVTVGIRAASDEGITNISTTPKLEAELKGEFTIFLGLILTPEVKIVSDKVADAKMDAKVGAELKGSIAAGVSTASSIHECKVCLSGEVYAVFALSSEAQLANNEKWKYSKELMNLKWKIKDFHYSNDFNEFEWDTCKHKKHKVTVQVKDKNGILVSGATVARRSWGNSALGETDENGRLELWLYEGSQHLTVTKGDMKDAKLFKVEQPKFVKFELKPPGLWENFWNDIMGADDNQRLSLGHGHSGYIDDNGNLSMWGENYSGQLGNGTIIDSSTPIKIMSDVRFISLGESHSAAITKDSNLYMWGYNSYSQLGNGTKKKSLTPIKIMDDIKSVSLKHRFSAAITNDDSLYMWGFNQYGQLGNETTKDSLVPIKIMDDVKSVSLGEGHSAAITNDGSLYMWGNNGNAQLGNGTTEQSLTPIKIMDNVKAVSLGRYHSAAITKDGSLYMWGNNVNGQLGNGTYTDSFTPIKIMNNVKAVSLGSFHSAAITNDGSLYMWGFNVNGQLGNGTRESSITPIKIMNNVKSVSLGSFHSAAITNEGSLYMWGFNQYGQLANEAKKDSLTPIKIKMPSDSARTIPNTEYLADEPTEPALQTAEFTGLLPNEVYNFYSIANNELLYVSQVVSDEKGNLNVAYIPKKDDTDAEVFLKSMTRTNISGAKVTVPDILCNGEEQFAEPVVTLDGVTLSETDYDIALQYSAVYPGEYDITIVGAGDYIDEVKAVYNVYCEHSFDSGKCTICKSLEGTVGDVNEDGAVGMADFVALQKFIVRKKTVLPKNGDVNGDSVINAFDVVKLKKIILNA